MIQETYNHLGGNDLKKILHDYKDYYLKTAKDEKLSKYSTKLSTSNNYQADVWKIIRMETHEKQNQNTVKPPRDELNRFFTQVGGETVSPQV